MHPTNNVSQFNKLCPACASTGKFYLHSKDKDYSFSGYIYHRCDQCRSIFLYKGVSCQKELTSLHISNWSSRTFIFSPDQSEEQRAIKTGTMSQGIIKILEGIEQKKYRILDFGCGDGGLVELLERTGHDGIGLDPSISENLSKFPNLLSAGTEELYDGSLEKRFPDFTKSFDIIILNGILEHIFDPQLFLSELRNKLLAPNGYLIGAVPSGEDLQIKYLRGYAWTIFAPFHRTLFSQDGLIKLLKNAFMTNIKVGTFSIQWGWTRALVWKFGIAEGHGNKRLSSSWFRFADYRIDLFFNEITKYNKANLTFICKNG